jgi:thymidylate synthase (FAD)
MGHLTNPKADEVLDVKHKLLDHGFVSMVDYMGGDQRIAEAAWVSSIDEVEAEKKTDKAMERIINYMMENRHTSPFEQVELVFRARMPIFVARQWVRHRTASLNEMSGRYRLLPSESYVPEFERMGGKGKDNKQGTEGGLSDDTKRMITDRLTQAQEVLWEDYGWLAETGLANELARLNLPLAAYTEWYWKIDLHNFFHFCGLRLHEHAQWEIRQYAMKMFELAWCVAPMAFKAFEEHRLYAVTFSRTEMEALKMIHNGITIGDALEDLGIRGKARERFQAKLEV